MNDEKLEKQLRGYFQSEVEKVEPSPEWWQKVVSGAYTHQQKQRLNLLRKNFEVLYTKLGRRTETALNLPSGSYRTLLFKFAVYVVLAVLFLGVSAGIVAAVANMTKLEKPPLSGSNQMTITITGLEQGEEATLRIGLETAALEIEKPLFEYQIQGTGASLTEDIAPILEDGYYLLLLEAPHQYFREPKGYSFMVRDSIIINPTGKAITFKLGPLPAYPAMEWVVSLSAPPKQPMPILQVPLWQRLLEPLAILVSLIIVGLLVIFIWRRRLKINH